MKNFIHIAILTLFVCAFLAGCGPSNTVQLTYKPSDASTLPAPGSTTITIVQFKDNRTRSHIGIRHDGSQFVASNPVIEWFSKSLAEELARSGYQVSFSQSINQAKTANPDYIITGEVGEIWLKESSALEISATIKAVMSVYSKKGLIFSENLSASQSEKTLPSSSTAETLLQSTLQEIIMPATKKIQEYISKNK